MKFENRFWTKIRASNQPPENLMKETKTMVNTKINHIAYLFSKRRNEIHQEVIFFTNIALQQHYRNHPCRSVSDKRLSPCKMHQSLHHCTEILSNICFRILSKYPHESRILNKLLLNVHQPSFHSLHDVSHNHPSMKWTRNNSTLNCNLK